MLKRRGSGNWVSSLGVPNEWTTCDCGGVVHCVWMPLTSTTVASSWANWSLVGDSFCTINTHSMTSLWEWAPLNVVVMGPRPSNVARPFTAFCLSIM